MKIKSLEMRGIKSVFSVETF